MSHWEEADNAASANGWYAKEERDRKLVARMRKESVAYWEKQDALAMASDTTRATGEQE